MLAIMSGSVGMVFLIVCSNAASLMLSRGLARRREMALRAALGAGRGRIVRQLLTESLLLALLGGAGGVALAYGCLHVTLTLVPPGTIPDESEITINMPVLLFTIGTSVLTAVLFGLA